MPFTITGTINSDVWLEYSTDNGSTWTRLTTLFPSGTSIVTSELPTNVDLKVRLVAVCNESLISNVLDYDYVAPVLSYGHYLSVQGSGNFITACTFTDLQLLVYGADSNVFSVSQFFTDANLTIPYDGGNEFRKASSGEITQTLQIDASGFVVSTEGCQ